jgi:hypothetical protein
MTLEELKALYKEKGATTRREEETEAGTKYYDDATQLGDGWTAFENDNRKIIDYIGSGMDAQPVYNDAPKTLGGFSKQEGDYVYNYDPEGKYLGRQKWNESNLKTMIRDLGPLAMAAITMGGGGAFLGNSLFGLTGNAASAAGGALAGGVNAWGNDQDVLKGALLGGVSGAGSAKLGELLGADTVGTLKDVKLGDVSKAVNFAQNPTLAGAANIASPYLPNVSLGEGAVSLNDVLKGVGTAKDLSSGDYGKMFKAITGIANDQGKSLKSSLGPDENFSSDLIPGYFDKSGQEMTVTEDPENLDAFLQSLSEYAAPPSGDGLDEVVITGDRPKQELNSLRTKEIKSDIPDEITPDQIDKLFPDMDFNDLLRTAIAEKTKMAAPTTTVKKPAARTTSTDQALEVLGLNAASPSQDPYADIKLMEELFGRDTAYKLRSLGASKNLASADLDALAKLLRG